MATPIAGGDDAADAADAAIAASVPAMATTPMRKAPSRDAPPEDSQHDDDEADSIAAEPAAPATPERPTEPEAPPARMSAPEPVEEQPVRRRSTIREAPPIHSVEDDAAAAAQAPVYVPAASAPEPVARACASGSCRTSRAGKAGGRCAADARGVTDEKRVGRSRRAGRRRAFRQGGIAPDLALRIYTTRLLGRDPSLVLHGGGNTSVKTRLRDLNGDDTDVLCVKGSGWDMGTIEPPGLPAVRLEALAQERVRARRCPTRTW